MLGVLNDWRACVNFLFLDSRVDIDHVSELFPSRFCD